MEHFFVYGTLKVGGYYAENFDNVRLTSVPGYITGANLFDLGPYPAMTEGVERAIVHGEVHTYSEPFEIIKRFDHIEGYNEETPKISHYIRKKVEVVIGKKGETVEAWAYFLNTENGNDPVEKGGRLLEDGFWPIPKQG